MEKERQEETVIITDLVCISWGNVSRLKNFSPLYFEGAF